MRTFFSYGPVDYEEHFCVPRTEIIERGYAQLIRNPKKGGHFFTIWAPRQCGKTWLMRQVKKKIEKAYGDHFTIGMMSMQGVIMRPGEPEEGILKRVPQLLWETFELELDEPPETFEEFKDLFLSGKGIFEKPVILFIDEFDSLPPGIIDQLVTLFRDIYLKRERFILHGLALIGVRAVLGVDSLRGSPFNIQRSLHVPNLTADEVEELFHQYMNESGQTVNPDVVDAVYGVTRGQPGLVGWFGELLTEKYNPGVEKPIDRSVWDDVYRSALFREWNNTVLNLVKKARGEYQNQIVELFTHSDIPFSIDVEWCAHAYLNGIIDTETVEDDMGMKTDVCRFANPFIQRRLYNALTTDLIGDRLPILSLDPLDTLEDVFENPEIDTPALLNRYKDYLKRLKAKGINPWKDQPRRSDMHYTEYVGHFHLYFWLQSALSRLCSISPEFPTGNGRVDLMLRCTDKQAIIEVKSFKDQWELKHSKTQAVSYAKKLGLKATTLALFVPVEDEDTLSKLSSSERVEGLSLHVIAIGWI
ncbi:conserved hypothetical protein [Desulfamplus magnetovallimortis]|uniref:ATPase domain protein, prokaryote domain protein n=2 Tax=Desulfamplus magnetovallimortis TaxID=1246637 RepID=A0A1W1HAH4_9BACT|nr:conserved hypothetical protein [Desulfamplus magnetovallimortis]